jgi:hypothetical protein
MGSAAYAYSVRDFTSTAIDERNLQRPRAIPRRDHAKLPVKTRIALVLGGAVLGWAVPIACAASLVHLW